MACSEGCLFFRHPLSKGTPPLMVGVLISLSCFDMRHVPRMDNQKRKREAVASQRPALIGKTIETIVPENEMVEQPDAQQVSSFP